MEAKSTERFDRIMLDEPVRKYLYEHNITPENYRESEGELMALFPDAEAYRRFVGAYLSSSGMLSYREFMRAPQRLDLFLHPRYIQQAPHIHDFFEVKYMLSGSGTVHLGADVLFLQESDFCFISPYVPHSSEIYSDEATMLNLVIPAENVPALFGRLMSFESPLQHYLSMENSPRFSRRYLYGRCDGDRQISGQMQALLEYFSHSEPRSVPGLLWAEATVEQCFLRLVELNLERGRIPRGWEKDERLSRMSAYMRTHLREVTLGEIAALFHFSLPYTSRFIKDKTGYTFQMLVLIFRMEEAARLLRETDWPVDQIALEVGLSGKTNFYRQFKSFYGKSPAVFRSEARSYMP